MPHGEDECRRGGDQGARGAERRDREGGMDHFRQHTSGYGMAPGFPPSWGEPTNMFGGSKDVLQAEMVMTVEPGVFIKEEGLGVRLIDNCIITDTGVELLSTTPRDIAVVE